MTAPVVSLPILGPKAVPPKSYFEIGLANEADDDQLRGLLRRSPIPGSISVAFEREPSFLDSCRVRGDFFQVGIGRDRRTGNVIGVGTRSVAPAFVNGRPMPLGYLADLRLDEQYRGGTLIARGYRFLRHLHEDHRVGLYTTMIFSGNHAALTTIASGRAGLPQYHDMGVVHSPGINIRRTKPPINAGCDVLRGSEDLLPEIVECLNRNNSRRQFAPVHTIAMFKSQWRDFRVTDFYVAVRGSRVIGVLGCWNQSSFKQTRVTGYCATAAMAGSFSKCPAPGHGGAPVSQARAGSLLFLHQLHCRGRRQCADLAGAPSRGLQRCRGQSIPVCHPRFARARFSFACSARLFSDPVLGPAFLRDF